MMNNYQLELSKLKRLIWSCLILIVILCLSCTQAEKISKDNAIPISKNKKDEFISHLNEPWDNNVYTRHQFYDFNSHSCYKMDNPNNQEFDKVHIISIDNNEKLKNYHLTSEHYTNLEALQIAHVSLNDPKLDRLFTSLEDKKHFKKLILYNCSIKDIPISIIKLKELQTLDLSVNNLKTLPPEITQLKKLSYLRVGTNREFEYFPNNLCELANLEILEFKATAISQISDNIGDCKNLLSIKANAGKLSSISNQIGQCENLQHINFAYNQIRYLPEGMGELKKLEDLMLSGNKIDLIPQSFAELTNLKSVHLYDNHLIEFPEVLTKLSNIESIMIHDNQIKKIPNSLGNLKKLDWFRIDDDKIPFTEIERLKDQIPKIRLNEHNN